MNITRILNRGVGSWLQFEALCNRSGLFNEKYLSYPIGQLLSTRFSERVHAEFIHPVLQAAITGRGRPPQIDFAYCDPYPTVKIAVETKWIGKTDVKVEDIIWDLIRLELIASNSEATCVFVLGGRRRDLERLFTSVRFQGRQDGAIREKPILSYTTNAWHTLPIIPTAYTRDKIFKKVFDGAPEIQYPHEIVTNRTDPFPATCQLDHFQVYSWRVSSAANRRTFNAKQCGRYM